MFLTAVWSPVFYNEFMFVHGYGKAVKPVCITMLNISAKLLKVQSLWLIMENNFILVVALAGHAVAYTIDPIFKHIIDCVQLYYTNGFTNIVL